MRRALLTAGGVGGSVVIPDPLPGPDPDPDPGGQVWRQFTNKTGCRDSDVPTTPGVANTSRMLLTARAAVTAIRIVIGGHWITEATGQTATITVNGVTHPLTFDGDPAWNMDQQYIGTVSDPLEIEINNGDLLDYRISLAPGFRNDSGLRWPHDAGEGSVSGVALTGAWPGSTETKQNWNAPIRVLGLMPADQPIESWLLSGDSNTELGWGNRALEQVGVAWTNLGMWGERTEHVANRATIRQQVRYGPDSSPWTHALCNFGTNDLGSGASVAQVQGWLITHWQWLAAHGAKVYQATILPGQKDAGAGGPMDHTPQVQTCNEWFRDGSPLNLDLTPAATGSTGSVIRGGHPDHPLVAGCFDASDVMSTGRNSGYIKPGHSDDGGHPNEVGIVALQAAMVDWYATLP